MTLPFSPYQEIVDIAMRFAPHDGEFSTSIGNLHVSRRSKPSDPLHSSYRPCFAFVLQGAKSLQLGTEQISYGTGDYLLTSLDLPVAWRVTEASPEVPHLCLGLAIDSEKLLELLSRIDIPRPAAHTDGQRGMASSWSCVT